MSEKKLIPEDKYPAVLVPMGGDDGVHLLRFAKAGSGNPQCLGYFKIVEGPYAGEVLPWFGALTKDSYERTMKSWRYCGWKGKDISKPGPMDQIVEIEVEHNTYNNKTHARVAWVNPRGGGAMKLANPLVGQDLAKLIARLNANASRMDEIEGERFDRSKTITRSTNGETHVERDEEQSGGIDFDKLGGNDNPNGAPSGWGDDAPPRDTGGWANGGGRNADPNDDIPF